MCDIGQVGHHEKIPINRPVYGWRVMTISYNGWLEGNWRSRAWPKAEMTAFCLGMDWETPRRGVNGTRAAREHLIDHTRYYCHCGIYLTKKRTASYYMNSRYCYVLTKAWGHIRTATMGIRAEHAKLMAVYIPRQIMPSVRGEIISKLKKHYPKIQIITDVKMRDLPKTDENMRLVKS